MGLLRKAAALELEDMGRLVARAGSKSAGVVALASQKNRDPDDDLQLM